METTAKSIDCKELGLSVTTKQQLHKLTLATIWLWDSLFFVFSYFCL
ncbi:hypothetical protein MPNE_0147 [Mycoplasmoides pneumoniae FH]|uniref:Uncharacterized protein n=1 Tax=Mycoplasmoides pneumoniae (strain ATCC 15531 / DSM 23978 / CIP 103766 / NBRC 14401 / NCTC 10119 / FH) TaxID=722438 RepID=A0A0H3DN90_MYCPB|nr:hypothetical protein MPNE_0147 [Mycoplasmoides pneumoniae FH]